MADRENTNFIIYTGSEGEVSVSVLLQGESVWLTINHMAELFGTTKQTVSYHLVNIFNEGELDRKATVKEILTVQTEGTRQVQRQLEYYDLNAIISVGYRIDSKQATRFRIWATRTLRELIIKGFVLDDKRLKQGSQTFGHDYISRSPSQ